MKKNIFHSYGITQRGTYHIEKKTVCQDAHRIVKKGFNIIIAAVADGLGSELYSDIASKIAVEISTDYCSKNINNKTFENEIIEIIKDSFTLAQANIEEKAKENDHDFDQYDTTLSLVVIVNETLYFGHSGDSCIIAYTLDGKYEQIVDLQQDELGKVYCLYFGEEKWVFGKYEKKCAGAMLVTDGVYKSLFPRYFLYEPIKMHISLAHYFLGARAIEFKERGEIKAKERIESFFIEKLSKQESDDLTLVGILNGEAEITLQSAEYYRQPDLQMIMSKWKERYNREAYPGLKENGEQQEGTSEDEKDISVDKKQKE